jgi:hypothetical protein
MRWEGGCGIHHDILRRGGAWHLQIISTGSGLLRRSISFDLQWRDMDNIAMLPGLCSFLLYYLVTIGSIRSTS